MDQLTRLAGQVGQQLQAQQAMVATAESCTGGGIAEAITRIPGSSAWFEAGYVTYSNRQKCQQLGVSPVLLAQRGAVSREVAEAMALGASQRGASRFAVAVTGLAGPDGGTPEIPVGTVWIAWVAGRQVFSRCYRLAGDRQAVRHQGIERALQGLLVLCQSGPAGLAEFEDRML